MKLNAILAGAAVLMVSAPALAQAPSPPTAPGAPATDEKPMTATPPANPDANMPGSTRPDTNNTATSPAAPDAMTPPSAAGYGAGWDEKKCADARKQGKPVDPSNCPAMPKPRS